MSLDYNNMSDRDLCIDFQQNYMKLHPDEKNIHHNLYIMKRVDRDGNVVDVKYGMNSLTDLGIWNLATSSYYYFPYTTSSGSTNYQGVSGGSGLQSYGVAFKTRYGEYFGKATNNSNTDSFVKTSYQDEKDSYNFYSSSGGGEIISVFKLLSGYYNYEVYDTNDVMYSSDTELTQLDIIAYGDKIGQQPFASTGIYTRDGQPSSLYKNINEKLIVTVYATMSTPSSLITSLWNQRIYTAIDPLPLAMRIICRPNDSSSSAMTGLFMKANTTTTEKERTGYSYWVFDYASGRWDDNLRVHARRCPYQDNVKGKDSSYEIPIDISAWDDYGVWNNLTPLQRMLIWYGILQVDSDFYRDANVEESFQTAAARSAFSSHSYSNGILTAGSEHLGHYTKSDGTGVQREYNSHAWESYDYMPTLTTSETNDIYNETMDKMARGLPFTQDQGTIMASTGFYKSGYYNRCLIENDTDIISGIQITDELLYASNRYASSGSSGWSYYNFRHKWFMEYYITLPADETLTIDYAHVDNHQTNVFGELLFGSNRDYEEGRHLIPAASFKIEELYRYNYKQKDWNIAIPFYTYNNTDIYNGGAFIDHEILEHCVFYKILINNTIYNIIIFTNPGFYKILGCKNTKYTSMYATDEYWNPNKWIKIPSPISNIPSSYVVTSNDLITNTTESSALIGTTHDLQSKKYYIAMGNFSSVDYVDRKFSNARFTLSTPNYEHLDDTVYQSNIMEIPDLRSADVCKVTANYYYPTVPMVYDEGPHPWILLENHIIYFDETLTNVTNWYYLDLPTETALKPDWTSSRFSYKNKIALFGYNKPGTIMILDASDPSAAPTGMHTVTSNLTTYVSTYGTFQFVDQNERYLATFAIYAYSDSLPFQNAESDNKSWIIDLEEDGVDAKTYKFVGISFIIPIHNTSLFVMHNVEDAKNELIIMDMDVFKVKHAENSGLSNTELLYEDGVIIQRITMDLQSNDNQPFAGIFGFNNHLYIIWQSGTTRTLWYYNLDNGSFTDITMDNAGAVDNLIAWYYASNSNSREYSRTCGYYCQYEDDVFLINNKCRSRVVNTGNSSPMREYSFAIQDSNPLLLKPIAHGYYTNGTNSVSETAYLSYTDYCILKMKTITHDENKKELLTYCIPREQCYRDYNLAVWDLGAFLDLGDDYSFQKCARIKSPYSITIRGNGDPSYQPKPYNNTYASGAIMKDRVILVNYAGTNIKIESVPVHRCCNFRVVGKTRTIQSYNNPKRVKFKTPVMIKFKA